MPNKPPAEGTPPAEDVALYVDETGALLTQAYDLIAAGDDAVDVHALMRVFHTIKGTAGFFYFTKSRVLAHAVEELLVGVRDHGWRLDGQRREVLHEAVEVLRILTSAIGRDADEDAIDTSGIWSRLRLVLVAAKNDSEGRATSSLSDGQTVLSSVGGKSVRPMPTAAPSVVLRSVLPLFRQLARFADALATDLGKRIDVQIEPTDVSMAGDFLTMLRQCLVHLIRNALVHGIELPAERSKLGKTPSGTLQLVMQRVSEDASARAEWVVMCADDGRGVDLPQLKTRALSQGVVSVDEAQHADAERIFDWMWLPGVSTAEDVTEMAGRGVGLDFVRETTRALGGRVEVMSQPGHGTRITLRFPESICSGDGRPKDGL